MTVPSREEVARAIAKERFGVTWGIAIEKVHLSLDAIARTTVNGEPLRIVIGTTHDRCQTCSGSGRVHLCGLPGLNVEHVAPCDHYKPCPDGRPVYWTVNE